ncbi:LIM/homeobox protein Lhx9-like isoform X2 [Lineus longissimus]|uniref:LIM/homeobox protein Lhx9-like isoform X2 n=1 Tax=Lineus longissimus TaxID=88925 RepID=UPI00315D0788
MVEKTMMSLCERGVDGAAQPDTIECQGRTIHLSPAMPIKPEEFHSFIQDGPHQFTTMPINLEDNPSICAGCSGKIVDRYYLLAVDKQWHTQCLKCSECELRLDADLTCFAKDGHIYCKEDYYRRFAVKTCSRCHRGISSNELVMRAKDSVYHISCFTCASCNKSLTPGEQFGMRDNMVYCRAHYELIMQGDFMPCLSPSLNGPVTYYNGVGAVQKGRPRKRKSPEPETCLGLGLHGQENLDGDMMDRDGYGGQAPRQKRMRTSFKHHQLRTMKSYFALNHNPDAKDLKQLASKTGLTKRVLQVWFQNARAKYRRNLLRQESGDGRGLSTDGDKDGDDGQTSLTELTNAGSPGLSDISSTPSLSDLGTASVDGDIGDMGSVHNGENSLTDLFSSSINSIN